jgi:hypothetical protein
MGTSIPALPRQKSSGKCRDLQGTWSRRSTKPGRPPASSGQNDKGSLNHTFIYIRNTKNRTNSTAEMGLGGHEPGREPPRPVRTSSSTMLSERPYSHTHTHMHTHTSITLYALTLHSTCTYTAVLHATSIQITHHAFLYQNAYDALTYTLTYPHSHLHSHSHHNARRHKRNLTRNHFTTLASQTARAISITLTPTFVSVSDRRDSERMANTEVRGRVT